MTTGPSCGQTRVNSILAVLFLCVAALVLYTVIGPWGRRAEAPRTDQADEVAKPDSPPPTVPSHFPPREMSLAPTAPVLSDGEMPSTDKPTVPPSPLSPGDEDDFAKDWYFQSVIGDIVELYYGDGTGRDVRVGKPFDTPEGERATIVAIGPDRLTASARRESDGKVVAVPRIVRTDLTAVTPTVVEAYRFSVNRMEEPGVAEPVLDGRKVSRYFFAHAASRLVFNLEDSPKRFRGIGYLGADRGRVRFVVKADGAELYASSPLSAPASVAITVDLPEHARALELIIDPLGDIASDHSFWVEPVLEK